MDWLPWCGGIVIVALFFYRRGASRALDDLASARVRLDVLQNQLSDAEQMLANLTDGTTSSQQSAAAHVETIRTRLEDVHALERILARRCSARVSRLTARILFLPDPDA